MTILSPLPFPPLSKHHSLLSVGDYKHYTNVRITSCTAYEIWMWCDIIYLSSQDCRSVGWMYQPTNVSEKEGCWHKVVCLLVPVRFLLKGLFLGYLCSLGTWSAVICGDIITPVALPALPLSCPLSCRRRVALDDPPPTRSPFLYIVVYYSRW